MAHCGYEATAVEDMLQHPLKALITSIRGPKTTGPMVAEPAPKWAREELKTPATLAGIPVKIER
jgi:ribosomal protein L30E